MPVLEREGLRVWRRRDRLRQLAAWAGWLVGTALFVYCCQLLSGKTIWAFVSSVR